MQKILIVKTSSLGDIIQTYPVIEYLRNKFPAAQIDWVVEKPFIELAEAHPYVSNVLCIAAKEWRRCFFQRGHLFEMKNFRNRLRATVYDVVFDLQGNVKSGLVVSQSQSDYKVGFARKSVPEWPNLLFTNKRFNPHSGGNIRDDYLSVVKAFYGDMTPGTNEKVVLKISQAQNQAVRAILQMPNLEHALKVVVCPGSAWINKQLTPEVLGDFLSKLQKYLKCKFLFIWGSAEEQQIANQMQGRFFQHSQVIDRMSLPMLQNLMSECDLVIAMDSLPLHLAGTTSTPSFSVFGPSSAHKYKPSGDQHFAFQGPCPYGRSFVKRCPVLRTCPTGACIRNLSGNDLYAQFRNWWDSLHSP